MALAECDVHVNCLEASWVPPRVDGGARWAAWHHQTMRATTQFIEARDLLLRAHGNGLSPDFRWPELTEFNWVRDYFDVIAAGNEALAPRRALEFWEEDLP